MKIYLLPIFRMCNGHTYFMWITMKGNNHSFINTIRWRRIGHCKCFSSMQMNEYLYMYKCHRLLYRRNYDICEYPSGSIYMTVVWMTVGDEMFFSSFFFTIVIIVKLSSITAHPHHQRSVKMFYAKNDSILRDNKI